MPIYEFKCRLCHKKIEIYRKMADYQLPCDCPVCGNETDKQVSQTTTDLKEFHTPIELHSVAAVTPKQIREFQEAGIDIGDPRSETYGTPVVRCRKDKLKALDVAGFTETK
jgi:putative FmdB family regulatory protein